MKKLTVVFFSLLILLSPLTAFAAEVNSSKDVVLWDTDVYKYQCELTDEYTDVTSSYIQGEEVCDEDTGECYDTSVTGYKSFDIHSDNEGYYAIYYIDPDKAVGKFFVSKNENDPIEGIFRDDEYLLNESNDYCGKLFKMEANESATALVDEWGTGDYKVKFIYLGDSITSVVSAGPLVYNFCVDAYPSEDYVDDECIDVTEMYPYLNTSFSEGQTLKVLGFSRCRDLSTTGTVKTDVTILDETFTVEVSYVDPAELIKEFALPDDFIPSCTISYNGVLSDLHYPEYLSVSQGDKEVNLTNDDKIVLANGRTYDCWFSYEQIEEGELSETVEFSYTLGGIFTKTITVTPDTESVSETFHTAFENSIGYMKFGIKILKGKAGDWTKDEGYYFLASLPIQLFACVKYYAMFGEYLNASVFVLILALPVIIIAAFITVIVIVVKKHRKKKIKNTEE